MNVFVHFFALVVYVAIVTKSTNGVNNKCTLKYFLFYEAVICRFLGQVFKRRFVRYFAQINAPKSQRGGIEIGWNNGILIAANGGAY